MPIDAAAPRKEAGYAARTVTKVPDWHGLVAWDVFFNNLTTGLFLTEATGELLAADVFAPLAKIAYPLALVLLLSDLTFLVLDLGDPLRFHHMLRVFKPRSPMSLGTWCLTVYSFPLTVAAGMSLLPFGGETFEAIRKVTVVSGMLPALGSALYKGVLLSTNSQPGWRDARWLGGYLTNSALLLGSAQMIVLAAIAGQEEAGVMLRCSLVVLLFVNSYFLFRLLVDLRDTIRHIFTPRQRLVLGLLIIGCGMLIPLCLLLLDGSIPTKLVAAALVLAGSLAIRFVIIRIPHALSHE